MAKARAIVKRRKAIQNIKKITRTMELIATSKFKRAMDRATQAEAYTRKIAELVAELGRSDLEVAHPLLEARPKVERALLLFITSNRGLAGGYNANVLRHASQDYAELKAIGAAVRIEAAGKRGITYCRFRGYPLDATYTHFEDRPTFDEVEPLANSYLDLFIRREIDRVDVAYTKFLSASRQVATVETLLPMARLEGDGPGAAAKPKADRVVYDFLPDPATILAEIVPASFKARLFKCFLDAAVSEQIARRIAMKSATESADEMIKLLTRQYNRARQTQITRELAEIIGGAVALE